MPHKNVLYFLLLTQRIINMQHRATRVAEDMLDTLFAKAANEYFGAGQFHDQKPRSGIGPDLKRFYDRPADKMAYYNDKLRGEIE